MLWLEPFRLYPLVPKSRSSGPIRRLGNMSRTRSSWAFGRGLASQQTFKWRVQKAMSLGLLPIRSFHGRCCQGAQEKYTGKSQETARCERAQQANARRLNQPNQKTCNQVNHPKPPRYVSHEPVDANHCDFPPHLCFGRISISPYQKKINKICARARVQELLRWL